MSPQVVVCDDCPVLADAVLSLLRDRLALSRGLSIQPDQPFDGQPPPALFVFDPTQMPLHDSPAAGLADSVRVVAYCARPSTELARHCMDTGCHGFIPKSADAEQLVRALRVVLDGGIYIERSYGQTVVAGQSGQANGRSLTPREERVLRLVAQGYSARIVAEQLGLSVKTVDTHRSRAMDKMCLKDRPALVRAALLHGWLG